MDTHPAKHLIPSLLLTLALALLCSGGWCHGGLPDLSSVPPDLVVPATVSQPPAPGLRVRMTTPGWEHTQVYHTLYLPAGWKPGTRLPIIAEYAGNGNYRNKFGDVSEGTVEGSSLGYGLSGGRGFLWVCLPYVGAKDGVKGNITQWWGDVDETTRYAAATLRLLTEKFDGDPSCVILAGFSRGAIGCNYLGLHDDAVAPLWRAFFCHSHYDGVRPSWPYPGADRIAALERLRRLGGRPQWISHEGSTAETEKYLAATGVKGDFTFQPLPYRNHSDQWVLRDIPERRAARAWLERVVRGSASAGSAR